MRTIIGLEFHIRLSARMKAFSPELLPAADALPNSNVHPISQGAPGTLPVCNREMVLKGLRMALACQADIAESLEFDRKHYFYPDLPKGYQITQHRKPLATAGRIRCYNHGGQSFIIELEEMHLEEDSARSIRHAQQRLIDLNRAGAPLLELVSKARITSPQQAADMLLSVQRLVRYLGISDGKMEDGSLRCDANISVMNGNKSTPRMEVKNMNSVAALKHALAYEQKRLSQALEQKTALRSETRFYQEAEKETIHGRFKEDAAAYRYLPEWDLPPVKIDDKILSEAQAMLPKPMEKLMDVFVQTYGLRPEVALLLFERRKVPMLFMAVARSSKNPVRAANWLNGILKNDSFEDKSLEESAQKISALIDFAEQGRISESSARSVLAEWIHSKQLNLEEFVKKKDLLIEDDSGYLTNLVQQILDDSPAEVKRYRTGKKALIGFFMGRLMKTSGGKAEPEKAKELLKKKLDEQ